MNNKSIDINFIVGKAAFYANPYNWMKHISEILFQ